MPRRIKFGETWIKRVSRRPPPEWRGGQSDAGQGVLFVTSVTPTATSGDNVITSRIESGGYLYGWNWEKWNKVAAKWARIQKTPPHETEMTY
jgi:hypothetical protein